MGRTGFSSFTRRRAPSHPRPVRRREAKFWIDPEIKLARNYRLSPQDLSRALELVIEHEQEIRDAWHRHFGR
jgi:hypothetical protein